MRYLPFRLFLLCAATLIAADLSLTFLFHPWFLLAIDGRSFRSRVLLDVLGCIPFLWPFAVAGVCLACVASRFATGLIWVVGLGVMGGLLYSRIVTLLIEPPDSVFNYPRFYLQYSYAFLTSCGTYLMGRIVLLPGTRLFFRQITQRQRSTKKNERYEY